MSIKVLVKSLFAIWALAIATLSIISHPGSKDLLMSVKVTSSGFVMHSIAYFVGVLLCYFSFNKKEDRGPARRTAGRQRSEVGGQRTKRQKSEIRSQMSEVEKTEIRGRKSEVGSRKDRGLRSEVTFIWISGLLIFLFSMILEVVQFYLPYRTFNVYDVVGNGIGILSFVFIWVFFSHPSTIFRGYRSGGKS
jgi:hypothetical protein